MEVNTATTNPINMYDYINNIAINPTIFIIILLVIIGYFVLFYSLGNNQNMDSSIIIDANNDKTLNMFIIFIIIILAILIFINSFQYFFNISVSAYIKNLFTNEPEIDIVVNQPDYTPAPLPEIKFKKQVFNIPGNYYNYDDAKILCKAYGADLATYKQIENAYNNGAEWCNYGWSAEQMALYPTQQKTYDNLQKIPGHEHDCGRPGINGGYIANKNVKFGINCYGYKQKITEEEEKLMEVSTPYPQTMKDIAFQKKVDYWKNNIDNVLVSPFNYNSWSG
jgi:hypothetical protein